MLYYSCKNCFTVIMLNTRVRDVKLMSKLKQHDFPNLLTLKNK